MCHPVTAFDACHSNIHTQADTAHPPTHSTKAEEPNNSTEFGGREEHPNSLVWGDRKSLTLNASCCRPVVVQDMLSGETKFLGSGYWREVRLAEYNGQELAIKTLRKSQEETKRNRERHRWEAVALDMVRRSSLVILSFFPCTPFSCVDCFQRILYSRLKSNPLPPFDGWS